MSVSRAKRLELDKRRADVASRVLKGESMTSIAESYELHHAQIVRDVKKLREDWQRRQHQDFDEVQAQHIAEVRLALREAWITYEASKQPIEIRIASTDEEGKKTYTVRTENRGPSATALEVVRLLLSELAKLYGFYAAAKKDVRLYDFGNLSEEELAALWIEEAQEVIAEAEGITGASATAQEGQG